MISQGTPVHAMSNSFTKTLGTTQESHDLLSSPNRAFQVNSFLQQNELSKIISSPYNVYKCLLLLIDCESPKIKTPTIGSA